MYRGSMLINQGGIYEEKIMTHYWDIVRINMGYFLVVHLGQSAGRSRWANSNSLW